MDIWLAVNIITTLLLLLFFVYTVIKIDFRHRDNNSKDVDPVMDLVLSNLVVKGALLVATVELLTCLSWLSLGVTWLIKVL